MPAGSHSVTPFYALRFVLQARREIALPVHQGALLYALICNANQVGNAPPAFPRDMLLDAPEQGRTRLSAGERFAFGGSLLCNSPQEAAEIARRLQRGLDRLGREGKPRHQGLGGNFLLFATEDLVAGREWGGGSLTAVPLAHIDQEIAHLLERDVLTVRFMSPLRLERPGKNKHRGHAFFDRRYFNVTYFLSRLLRRMTAVGVQGKGGSPPAISEHAVELLENRLVWLDTAYGGKRGKTLGGAVGRVRLRVEDPVARAALVWGQYTRVGKNTHFSFGRYRIEELGPDPFACNRAQPLLAAAWNHPRADQLSMAARLEPGELSTAIQELQEGTYIPRPYQRLRIGQGEKSRVLQIPARRDRVLQRLVLENLAPGLDQFLESSSFAWRRGLGRHSSARAVERAFKQGYRYAVVADIDRFFDSINPEELADRLHAYLADDATVELLMTWVRASGQPGLPTGAPLSPLLANLFLDHFDERIAARGGRLIRYGDDFLILCETQQQAETLFSAALEEAHQLQLRLNESPQPVQDLRELFTFLGFRFECGDRWLLNGNCEPRLIEELGWRDAEVPRARTRLVLPGEMSTAFANDGITGIVGPLATRLEARSDGSLWCHCRNQPLASIPVSELETLVVLGAPAISGDVVRELCERGVTLLLADERGLCYGELATGRDAPTKLLMAQVDATRSPQRALDIARALVAAKLHNFGRLLGALEPGGGKTATLLAGLDGRATVACTLEELRGIEGRAAAVWYEQFARHLGPGFTFERRVAPDADDPVNVLLNIAHTLAHRLAWLSIKVAGLAPMLGFLHVPNARFPALAADLQEPFRHLMERAVINATHELRPKDFRRTDRGRYRLMIAPAAARTFQALLWKTLSLPCQRSVAEGPVRYRDWFMRQARSLRRHLLNEDQPFTPFRQP